MKLSSIVEIEADDDWLVQAVCMMQLVANSDRERIRLFSRMVI